MKDDVDIEEFDLTDIYSIKKESKYKITYPNRILKIKEYNLYQNIIIDMINSLLKIMNLIIYLL